MKNNSFIITGFGRSGTKFLSHIMNKSNKWTVKHEPRGNEELTPRNAQYFKILNDIFDTEYYGEVNSYLRFYLDNINVNKKALILRHPKDIYLSVCNRKEPHLHSEFIHRIEYWYNMFFKKYNNLPCYFFEKFTTDINYLNRLLLDFGIDDVLITENDITKKININKEIKYKSINDLPIRIQTLYNTKFKKIVQIYENRSNHK